VVFWKKFDFLLYFFSFLQKINKTSSRSHTILTIYLKKTLVSKEFIESSISFVDLAGSERVKNSYSK